MSARHTGFLRRGWTPRDFQAVMVERVEAAPRWQLERLVLMQKAVLAACEDLLSKLPRNQTLRAAQIHLSRVIEASPQDVQTLQQRVNQWQDNTFPDQAPEGILAHFGKEFEELKKAFIYGLDPENEAEEAADCAILLLVYAGNRGFDLIEEVERKFAVIQRRKWQAPGPDGSIEHIREASS